MDEDKQNYIDTQFNIHSRVSKKVRDTIIKKRQQVTSIWDVWGAKYKSWPKGLQITVAVIGYLYVVPFTLAALLGLVKASWDEFIKVILASGLLILIWFLQNYLLIF